MVWGPLVREALSLISEGIQTNLWGLRCPLHCEGTSLAALLSAFLLGFLLAAGIAAFLVLYPPQFRIQRLAETRDRVPEQQTAGPSRLSLYGHTRLP